MRLWQHPVLPMSSAGLLAAAVAIQTAADLAAEAEAVSTPASQRWRLLRVTHTATRLELEEQAGRELPVALEATRHSPGTLRLSRPTAAQGAASQLVAVQQAREARAAQTPFTLTADMAQQVSPEQAVAEEVAQPVLLPPELLQLLPLELSLQRAADLGETARCRPEEE